MDTVTNIPHGGLAQMEGRGLLGGGDGRGDNYNYTQSLTPNNHDQVIFVDAAAVVVNEMVVAEVEVEVVFRCDVLPHNAPA